MSTFELNQQFESIKNSAVNAVKSVFPVKGKLREIRLNSVFVDDKIDQTNYREQARVKSRGGTWGVPVMADLSLIEEGKEIDRSKIKLFNLPKITDRYSYIVNGNEYQVTNQLRLKSGTYTRRGMDGALKTHINLSEGRNFYLRFDEEKGIFYIYKIVGSNSNFPLYPILKDIGASDSDIKAAWGPKLFEANARITVDINRVKQAFKTNKSLAEYFDKDTKMIPEVNKITLGHEHSNVSSKFLIDASKKLLDVQLGKKETDDRDSLEFKEIHSIDDFIKERIQKNGDKLQGRIKRSIDNPRRNKLSQIVNPASFTNLVESFFTQDDKSSTPEQTNPLEMVSGQYGITIMGSGGIQASHAITNEMREIHPTHYGFLDPIQSPESHKIGAVLQVPLGAVKEGNELKTIVLTKDGKTVKLRPTEAKQFKIAFPNQNGPTYKAMFNGNIIEAPYKEIDYFTPSHRALMSWSSNLIPFLPAVQGNRAMMAAKQLEQAISLKHREAPLVQTDAGGKSMEKFIGENIVVKAPEDGVITKIEDEKITMKGATGKHEINLYHHFAMNRKSFMHHTPVVKVGDKVKKDQMIAESNFTKGGELALGINLRAAYMPYKGLTFNDGIVITESASKKLTSEHIHKKELSINENTVLNLRYFGVQYPNTLKYDNTKKLDEDGIIKKGQVVHKGDILIAALQKHATQTPVSVKAIHRQLADRPKNVSVEWIYDEEGVVVDVHKSASNVTVFIKTEEQAKIGDKLTGRFGNKGVITGIIPDKEAPRTKSGDNIDIFLNPHGIISRINIGQTYESAAGKAAEKNGKPFIVENFTGENYLEKTKKFLKDSNVDDKEEVIDHDGKSLGKVHVGKPYILKLYKQSQGNFSYRQGGPGDAYDINMQPLKQGGEDSAKAIDLLTNYCLLSHGARANLRDMSVIKGNENDEYWKALKSGQLLPPPKAPFVYEKFMGFLRGAGIDVKKNGTKLALAPLTDKQVLEQSRGEVKEPIFFRAKDMKPEEDGFMDPKKFGGLKGTGWGHITLKEPIVNPVFEDAVKKITDLKGNYEKLLNGEVYYHDGKITKEKKGLTGGKAIEHILSKIDVDAEIESLIRAAAHSKASKLDDINKKLRYLQALKTNNLKPTEAYMRKEVPVVPPIYRPIYTLPDGNPATHDVNLIYQNLGILNKIHQLPVMDLMSDEAKTKIRNDIYEHAKGISGIVDIPIKGKERSGFISEIKGGADGQPKDGFFLSKVIGKKQDYVGRGTIVPETSLGIDEVALPEKMAWKIFEPFVVRELVTKYSKTPNEATKEVEGRTKLANVVLKMVMAKRHVLIKRDPALHKFSIMAMKPQITSGTSIKIPHLVCKGFNADFDGDTMLVTAPISDEANREAEKMLPSKNLYQPGTGKLMVMPEHEALTGLYYLSKDKKGREEINKVLGGKFTVNETLNKGSLSKLLNKISHEVDSKEFARIVFGLKNIGETHTYERGFTIGINDLAQFSKERDAIYNHISQKAKNASQEELSKLSKVANGLIDKVMSEKLKDKDNPLYDQIDAGSRGSISNLRALMISPMFINDARNRVVPTPIRKSYTEGLDMHDYWTSMYGARKGMMDRAIQTALPGTVSKDIMATTIDNVISKDDCGTQKGITTPTESSEILDRYLAGDQHGLKHNTLITSKIQRDLISHGAKTIVVRSPITCLQPKGTCAHCFGIDEHGSNPSVGENVGAKMGQTMSEPLVQLVMNCSDGHIYNESGEAVPFIDYYDSLDVTEVDDGMCLSKEIDRGVLDSNGKLVGTNRIQKHMPDDDMLFIKTKNGKTLLVQANHPLWAYMDQEGVNRIELAAEDLTKDMFLKTIDLPSGNNDCPVHPYFVGRYLSDGSTRYGNGTKKYEGIAVATIITGSDIDIQYDPEFEKQMSKLVKGREAKLKRLSKGFNLWKKEDLESILAGFIDGDSSCFIKNNTTVAQIYTSSFYILQQIEMICNILKLKFSSTVVPREPLQKSPTFTGQIRFYNDSIWKKSVKLSRLAFMPASYEYKSVEFDRVKYIKRLWTWDLEVYDIKTTTKSFMCGLVENHNTFHTGGAAGTGAKASGYKRIDQLLSMPKNLHGAATLATMKGRVSRIVDGLGGGYDIYIGTEKHHVAHGNDLLVKVGDNVEPGDRLSTGPIKPQELAEYKGMKAAQEYIVNELHSEYKDQGQSLHKKVFETVVRSLTNTTKILNKPKGTPFLPGDIAPYSVVMHHNENLERDIPIGEATGCHLAVPVAGLRAGHELTQLEVNSLEKAGIKTVRVKFEEIEHKPFIKGITSQPMLKKDWMSALGYRNLKKAIIEGAGQSWETDTSGYHPIPAFAKGITFGKGSDGRY